MTQQHLHSKLTCCEGERGLREGGRLDSPSPDITNKCPVRYRHTRDMERLTGAILETILCAVNFPGKKKKGGGGIIVELSYSRAARQRIYA